MVVQAPVVQIDGTYHRLGVVHHKAFGVNETGGVGVELDAGAVQGGKVGLGQIVGGLFVGDPRQDDPHIHAPAGSVAKRRLHLPIQNEIGRHDMNIPFCPVQQVDVDLLAHPVVVQGRVGIGHHETGDLLHLSRVCQEFVVLGASQIGTPELEEHDREAADSFALEHDGGVLPVTVFFVAIDVLVRQIHAAGKACVSVDDQDLPVIPVVVVGGDEGLQGREDLTLDAKLLHFLRVISRQKGELAGAVVHEPHIHARRRFPLQNLQNGVPHVPLVQDEILQEDELFCLFQFHKHPLEKSLAGGEIGDIRFVEDREAAAAADIAGHARYSWLPGGERLQDGRILIDLVAALDLPLSHDPLQEPVPHIPAGVPVEQGAEDREQRHQHHPGQLGGGFQVGVQHHQHRNGRQHRGTAHHMAVPVPEPDAHRYQQPCLEQKQKQNEPRPAEDRPAQPPFAFSYQFFFSHTHGIPPLLKSSISVKCDESISKGAGVEKTDDFSHEIGYDGSDQKERRIAQ